MNTEPECAIRQGDGRGIDVLRCCQKKGISLENVREIFETNTFGSMAVTQAVLPQFRQQEAGVIINVTSSVTLKPHPLLSVYTASKAAITAFTESLALELQQFNVRVRLVLPGQSSETRFRENAQPRLQGVVPEAYADLAQSFLARMKEQPTELSRSLDVAEAVWRAVNDPSCPVRLPAGADAVALAEAR